jgi:hypothetical protein
LTVAAVDAAMTLTVSGYNADTYQATIPSL